MKEIKKKLEQCKLKVSDQASDKAKYAKDFSMVPQSEPALVAHAKNADEIVDAVITASDNGIPLYPVSSKLHFNGEPSLEKAALPLIFLR